MKLWFLGILTLLVGCQSAETRSVVKKQQPVLRPSLMNWQYFNEEGFTNVSFPLWFNREEVLQANIESVALSFRNFNVTDSLTIETDTLPYRVVRFDLNRDGAVKRADFQTYFSGIQIAEDVFVYPKVIDSLGYSLPKPHQKTFFGTEEHTYENQQFPLLEFSFLTAGSYIYSETSSRQERRHFFIADKENWNVGFIDMQFNPNKYDVFYYGLPNVFRECFSIQNMVEKEMKMKQFYYPNGVLKAQWFYDNEFVTKRYFEYDKDGVCSGFVDSLKTSDEAFIHLEKAKINYQNSLPLWVAFYNQEDAALNFPIKSIVFEYTIRDTTAE